MTARICCLLFILTLFLPLLEKNSSFLPTFTLAGKETNPPKASWSLQNWMDGTFQQKIGKRRESRLGLRSYLVRTYNQLHYSLFQRVASTSGTNVILGKDNWLYEKVYVRKYLSPSRDDGSFIHQKITSMRILQDRLAEWGVTFVFVMAPSKAEIYPEYIPEKSINNRLSGGMETDYQQARAALVDSGVHFVDGHSLFLKEKQEKPHQLFSPGGIHWNKYGAYLAWKEIDAVVGGQLNVPLQLPPLVKVESKPSEIVEADLGRLLNLWDTSLTSQPTHYPVFARSPSQSEKPSILIIGDSFLFTLIDIISRAQLATDVDAWYYFKRHFKYSSDKNGILDLTPTTEKVLDRKHINWEDLLQKDMVILVATEYWLPKFDFGFIDRTLASLPKKNGHN